MAQKLYEEDSVQAIANAIRKSSGSTDVWTIAEMPNVINGLHKAQSIEWHQCPELPRKFVEEVAYDPDDYSVSGIGDYAPATAVLSNYKPIGKTIGDKTFYNEVPNVETPFVTEDVCGTVKPLDQVRYINTPSAPNVRDLGGWKCDGGTVKYGLLFRGGYLSLSDREIMVEELGIRHDLDLRGGDTAITVSPLGEDVYYTRASAYNWYTLANTDVWKTNLRCVFDAVIHNNPLYFHCAAGADRTGTLACVLEGLLGMSQSDIDKDYELTCFYFGTATDGEARRRNESEWQGLINEINAKNGSTFRDKCVTFAAELGFTADEINAYRAAMIDGTPETVAPNVDTYAVGMALGSGITVDNATTTIDQYQPYEVNVCCEEGHVISSVKVIMGGTDITSKVWGGTKTSKKWPVTMNLSNCTASGNKKAVIDGESCVAYITADDGYTLSGAEIRILMGGNDVSNYYSDGVIAIPNVTGDITIIVTAIEQAVSYTNRIPLSVEITSDAIYNNGLGYMQDTRLNSSGTTTDISSSSTNRMFTTGLLPLKKGDTIRFRNCWIDPHASGDYPVSAAAARIHIFSSNKTLGNCIYWSAVTTSTSYFEYETDADGNIISLTWIYNGTSDYSYIQFTLAGLGEKAVITINEEID